LVIDLKIVSEYEEQNISEFIKTYVSSS